MKTQFKIYAVMAAMAAGVAFAQEVPAVPETEQPVVETPAVPEAEPAPVPEPVAQVAEVAETVAPAVPAPEPSNIKIQVGVRPAVGISAFRGHKAFDYGAWKLQAKPSFSFGFGVASDIQINDLLSVGVDLQYTQYRANNEFAVKTGADFHTLNEVEITFHALELPILARFNLMQGFAYAEVGPQLGYNLRAVINKNAQALQPDLNAIAFGPTVGGGVKINGILVGARLYFGVLEYAENSNGYPWTFQVGATQFLF